MVKLGETVMLGVMLGVIVILGVTVGITLGLGAGGVGNATFLALLLLVDDKVIFIILSSPRTDSMVSKVTGLSYPQMNIS